MNGISRRRWGRVAIALFAASGALAAGAQALAPASAAAAADVKGCDNTIDFGYFQVCMDRDDGGLGNGGGGSAGQQADGGFDGAAGPQDLLQGSGPVLIPDRLDKAQLILDPTCVDGSSPKWGMPACDQPDECEGTVDFGYFEVCTDRPGRQLSRELERALKGHRFSCIEGYRVARALQMYYWQLEIAHLHPGRVFAQTGLAVLLSRSLNAIDRPDCNPDVVGDDL
jgi:hypothetical protein